MQREDRSAIPWPQDFAALEEKLLSELGSDSQIYIHRAISEGKSGACVLVADVTSEKFTGQAILKLDRAVGSKLTEEMEYERHQQAIERAPEYAEQYLPKLVCAVEQDNEVAALTTIAARGLEYAVAWSACSYGPQLHTAVHLSDDLLELWNAKYALDPEMRMPQDLIDGWLDYRHHADRGGRIHEFLGATCKLPPETLAFSCDGDWFPNPLAFARRMVELQDTTRLRPVRGNMHGDLHGKNMLVTRQFEDNPKYYLIDLDFYRDDGFLFYDHAIFELDYLLTSREQIKPSHWKTLMDHLRRERPRDEDSGLGGEDIGILQLVEQFRKQATDWIDRHEPNRLSFLESQYMLARLAAGLAITHQRREDVKRAMAFVYAAYNLKDYLAFHAIDWPKHGPELALDALNGGGSGATATGTGFDAADQADLQAQRPPKRAIAVLPFNFSGETHDYDVEGMTERIVAEMARIDWFTTIGGSPTQNYRGKDPDPQAAGKELNAHYVLLGNVRERGSEVQMTVRLVATYSGDEVWSDRYRINTKTENVLAAEDKITFAVASRVDAQLAVSERARAMRKRTENLDSWDYFMRARWHFFQYTREDDEEAQKLCRQAIEIAPNFSYPNALLSQMISRSRMFEWAESANYVHEDAVKLARHAVNLDPGSSFAHESLSRAYLFAGRAAVALQEAETAITLDPVSSGAHWCLAMALAFSGKPAEAIPSVDIAMRMNPYDQGIAFKLALKASAFVMLGKLEKAEAMARQTIAAGHGYAMGNLMLAVVLQRQGKDREASEAVGLAMQRRPDLSQQKLNLMLSGLKPNVREVLMNILVQLGVPKS